MRVVLLPASSLPDIETCAALESPKEGRERRAIGKRELQQVAIRPYRLAVLDKRAALRLACIREKFHHLGLIVVALSS